MRAQCGCLVEDGMVLHGYDGPCAMPGPPTAEEHCAAGGHGYYADDFEVGRCYCGSRTFPLGGPSEPLHG